MPAPCSTRGTGCINILLCELFTTVCHADEKEVMPELLHYSDMKFTAQGDEPCIKTDVSLHVSRPEKREPPGQEIF